LRTPLFVIAGHAELMAHPDLQPTEAGWELEYGQAIHQAALDLLERVNEILDLAKLETKKMTLELDDVAVVEIARAVAAEMAPLARQAGLRVHVDVPRDLPLVRADRNRLRDVVRNLFANAIKYTPAGGEISVRASARSSRVVEVTVADTGIGIPKDAQALVFEPFYQVPGSRSQNQQTSTGLGLALAHRLVEAHGGTMRLDSRVGEGSAFTFTLKTASSRGPRPRSTRARQRRQTTSTSS
jgi:signal transduction histidine kinase